MVEQEQEEEVQEDLADDKLWLYQYKVIKTNLLYFLYKNYNKYN